MFQIRRFGKRFSRRLLAIFNALGNLRLNPGRGLMRPGMKTFINYRRLRLTCLRHRGRI